MFILYLEDNAQRVYVCVHAPRVLCVYQRSYYTTGMAGNTLINFSINQKLQQKGVLRRNSM